MDSAAEIKVHTIAQIEVLRSEMHCEMLGLHEAVMEREMQLQGAKQARRRAIEAAVSSAWRKMDLASVQESFLGWRCA
jgi:hypothetical protein